jgi:AbrB family looped-hinge helix DNA binding protein
MSPSWSQRAIAPVVNHAKWQNAWYDRAMKTTIDAAGRIVVPKRLRDEMGLRPGQILQLEVTDGRLEVEIAPVEIRLEERSHGPVAVADQQLPRLTGDMVRQTLERTRR